MIDHIILTVSNVECSLAFYEAALAPLAGVSTFFALECFRFLCFHLYR
jgi:hypothetical protein